MTTVLGIYGQIPRLPVEAPIVGYYNQLVADNPTPLFYQLVIEQDKVYCNGQQRQKIGDGVTPYANLPYTNWEKFVDYGSFTAPNPNTPINAGSFTAPAVNFSLDFCRF